MSYNIEYSKTKKNKKKDFMHPTFLFFHIFFHFSLFDMKRHDFPSPGDTRNIKRKSNEPIHNIK